MVQVLASRLVLLDEDGDPERPLPMDRDRVVLGRSSENDVVLADPMVSRHHAEIRHDHGRWVLLDLGSTHGTTRNGQRLDHPVVLHHGDVIGLGPVQLRFEEAAEEAPTALHPPVPPSQRSYRFEGIEVRDQHAGGAINNVEGVQNNYVHQVLQERRSFLREVAATRTRARIFVWLGLVLVVVGIAIALVVVGGLFSDIGEAFRSSGASGPPEDPFGVEIAGVPLIIVAAAIEIAGIVMIITGIVLHVTATARRKDIDRRLPDPRIPRHR
jgi:uncharacterized membrane protein YidH (DUF202 family)